MPAILQNAMTPAQLNGKKVRVYRNLHTGGYSVQARIPGKGWRVVLHTNEVRLADVTFEINETGRQRVLREKVKNVHAYVLGTFMPGVEFLSAARLDGGTSVTYNPYKMGNFYNRNTGEPVTQAPLLIISERGYMSAYERKAKKVVA